ncbi:MAG: TonB family protein [Zoogloeaceae bacterium]|jgi:protein TonB|nr:TonB family protein [Zoogloeaceae bacterium]
MSTRESTPEREVEPDRPDFPGASWRISRFPWRMLGASLCAHSLLLGWTPARMPPLPPLGNALSATLRPAPEMPTPAPDPRSQAAAPEPERRATPPSAIPPKPRTQPPAPKAFTREAREFPPMPEIPPEAPRSVIALPEANNAQASAATAAEATTTAAPSHASASETPAEESGPESGNVAPDKNVAAGRSDSGQGGSADARPALSAAASDALRDYRIALGRSARAFKRYPALARERREEGIAQIRLDANTGGRIRLQVEQASGHPLLDEAALVLLREAVQRTPVPEALRQHPFSFILAIEYHLESP